MRTEVSSPLPQRVETVVVGGGISGLTVAHELVRRDPTRSVLVLEKEPRIGGIVGSRDVSGYRVDTGPHGFVHGETGVRTLVDHLGLGEELLPATEEAEEILVLREGRLAPVPTTVRGFLTNPLLSPMAKLRVLGDLVVPPRSTEETVFDFCVRRFGVSVARAFAVPAVRGVTGGDARSLSIDAKFPSVRALEKRYRSVLVGATWEYWKYRRAALRRGGNLPSVREFGMRLHTFRGHGMQRIIDALGADLGERVRLGRTAERLDRVDGRTWRIALADGQAVDARQVVLALPTAATADLIEPHLPEAATTLAGVHHPDVRVIALGYRRRDLPADPRGIGFLASPGDGASILGTIHTSTIFPEQAPADRVLIRTLAGGSSSPGFAALSTAEAAAVIHRELARVFRIGGEPVFTFDHVWRRAIPEYHVGYREQADRVLADVAATPGLHVAGNAYRGVGVNDCVRLALAVAGSALAEP
ncbi:protoporphyrinogen oxidase [Streptoalloteichus hindustanus]|uniref:Coproporphyrinogen III oxidase n=1 Tax=Streptoalloteichus hindustanus TaxID=2017 RepID=A0A1M5PR36_STRHI|nr:protoporphyrinogen oxidase [Streptoalloteichus hindustanus]SHH04046.1 oxygen-dependent protoporphyrinogen oxidase [Streptoalloteichus hindustanus]